MNTGIKTAGVRVLARSPG